jgi:hypothetical protein
MSLPHSIHNYTGRSIRLIKNELHPKCHKVNDIISDTNFAYQQPSIKRETLTSVIERELKSIHGLAWNTTKQKVDVWIKCK